MKNTLQIIEAKINFNKGLIEKCEVLIRDGKTKRTCISKNRPSAGYYYINKDDSIEKVIQNTVLYGESS